MNQANIDGILTVYTSSNIFTKVVLGIYLVIARILNPNSCREIKSKDEDELDEGSDFDRNSTRRFNFKMPVKLKIKDLSGQTYWTLLLTSIPLFICYMFLAWVALGSIVFFLACLFGVVFVISFMGTVFIAFLIGMFLLVLLITFIYVACIGGYIFKKQNEDHGKKNVEKRRGSASTNLTFYRRGRGNFSWAEDGNTE